jgi:hypothetical protein
MMFENKQRFNIVKLFGQKFEIVKMGLLNPISYYLKLIKFVDYWLYIYIVCKCEYRSKFKTHVHCIGQK